MKTQNVEAKIVSYWQWEGRNSCTFGGYSPEDDWKLVAKASPSSAPKIALRKAIVDAIVDDAMDKLDNKNRFLCSSAVVLEIKAIEFIDEETGMIHSLPFHRKVIDMNGISMYDDALATQYFAERMEEVKEKEKEAQANEDRIKEIWERERDEKLFELRKKKLGK